MPLRSKSMEGEHWATPSTNLWVGNLPPDVTDSDLMELFAPYGSLDTVISYSSRTFAFVLFRRVEDAKAAENNLQGASLRGIQIRIEFARPAKPCRQLWVGGVGHAVMKEDLEAEFRKFGKIEDIKFVRDRGTAFIEFLNLDDAIRAVKVVNGKRLDGGQICVDFVRSQSMNRDLLVDHRQFQVRPEHLQPSMGRNSQPGNILWIGFPPSFQIDEQLLYNAMILFGEIDRIKSFPSRHYSFVEFRSIEEARRAKEGLQGRLFNDPRITIMYSSSDLARDKDYPDFYLGSKERPFQPLQTDVYGHNLPLVPSNNVLPSALGLLPSAMPGIRPPTRSTSGAWDVLDRNQFQRDSKRTRIDDALLIGDAPFPLRNIDDRGLGLEQPFIDGGGSGPKNHLGPFGTRITSGVPDSVQPDVDHVWRGIIAKGGTPVCRARCVPIGKGIRTEIPDVVDCAARTGLDMLMKYYADAIGFDIVFFLPDSEKDFASYTEFLRYLKGKNRAGVANFVDNTTLFLVPPSDFLTKVLKVTGPERLYGVVLKYPLVPGSTSMQQAMHLPSPTTQYMQQIPHSQTEYGSVSIKQEQVLPMDYSRLLYEDSKRLPKPLLPATSVPPSALSVPADYAPTYTASAPQARVTLTPELIATLTSLLPATTQSSTTGGTMTVVGPSTVKPPFPPFAPNDGNQSHLWKQDQQIVDVSSHLSQQFGSIHNAQYQPYPPASYTDHPAQVVSGSFHTASSLQPLGTVSSIPMTNFITPQNGQVSLSSQVSQQYQVGVPHSTEKGYGMVQGSDASVFNSSKVFQQPNNFFPSSNQVSNAASQQQTVMPYTMDKVNSEPPNQQIQPPSFGVPHSTEKGYGVVQGSDASVFNSYNASVFNSYKVFQQPNNFIPSSNQVSNDASQQQTVMPYTVDKVNSEPLNQQIQPPSFGVPHSTEKGYGVVQGSDASVFNSYKVFQQPNNFIPSSNQVSNDASQQQTVMPYTVDKVNSEPPNQQIQPPSFGVDQGMSELEADRNQRYQSTLQFAANLLQQIQQRETQGGHGPGNQQ